MPVQLSYILTATTTPQLKDVKDLFGVRKSRVNNYLNTSSNCRLVMYKICISTLYFLFSGISWGRFSTDTFTHWLGRRSRQHQAGIKRHLSRRTYYVRSMWPDPRQHLTQNAERSLLMTQQYCVADYRRRLSNNIAAVKSRHYRLQTKYRKVRPEHVFIITFQFANLNIILFTSADEQASVSRVSACIAFLSCLNFLQKSTLETTCHPATWCTQLSELFLPEVACVRPYFRTCVVHKRFIVRYK